ncbi:ComEA family DNA-binding protein [Ideonella sp.]|uniref:ComEA family DNA-binding protein n=1 Tax=Ideonella sp. TaxID=1929293 RepID=UPI0035B05136
MPGPLSPDPIARRRWMSCLLACAAATALPWPSAAARSGIDLNRANQAELEMVPGVGPQLSERILGERAHGPFVDWADFVARMKGIGPSHARRLSAAGLRIGGRPVDADAQAPAASR